MSILDIITEGLLEHGLCAPDEREGRAEQLLRDVGMGPESLHRYPHEFSGGQRQRICIARALSLKPRLIVCDEAVSALDVSVQAQVVNLLMDLRDQYRLSYLFIAHDLSVVRHISDRIAVMYLGQIVEEGPADAVIQSPRHPYTRALVSAVPRIGIPTAERQVLTGEIPSPSAPPRGCRFNTRCPFATERCRTEAPALALDRSDHRAACLRLDELD